MKETARDIAVGWHP